MSAVKGNWLLIGSSRCGGYYYSGRKGVDVEWSAMEPSRATEEPGMLRMILCCAVLSSP